jgi:hypothetical protein
MPRLQLKFEGTLMDTPDAPKELRHQRAEVTLLVLNSILKSLNLISQIL